MSGRAASKVKTMTKRTVTPYAWFAGIAAITIVAAFAFSAADTGARSATASVVSDSDSFLALESNTNSPYAEYVSEDADGKLSVAFDGTGTASGSGINPDSSYTFDTLINVTNKGLSAADVSITIAGADETLCEVAFTSTTSQASGDYSATPASIELASGSTAYLGLKFSGEAKTNGESVDCEITATATEAAA